MIGIKVGISATLVISAIAFSASAIAQPNVVVRLGHVMPVNHFENEAFLRLAENVSQKSNGQIEIQVFAASQLGSEREQTEQVDTGALECHSSGGAIQNYAPGLGAWSLPFLFSGPEHYERVMDGPVGEQFKELLLEKSNIRILAFYPNGVRMFFNNDRPFTQLADFKGVKIRVDDQPISAQIWRALGANPVPLPVTELYSALETGVVDAGEQPAININRMKLFEVAKQVTATRHSLTTFAFMCNEQWWDSLSDETRSILTESIAEMVPTRREASWNADKQAIADLKGLGVNVVELANPEEFQQALLPLYESFGKDTGTTETIQTIQQSE